MIIWRVNHPKRRRTISADTIITPFIINQGMNSGAKVSTSETESQAFMKETPFFCIKVFCFFIIGSLVVNLIVCKEILSITKEYKAI